MKHNNLLPNQHFRKDWQLHVKTWFDQPGKKQSRRTTRTQRASRIAPRPLDSLRPCVRCPTVKYNIKLRKGRGFTLEELKVAGVRHKEAAKIGISVDHRRHNKSQESLDANVKRIKAYMAKLLLFPKHGVVKEQGVKSVASLFPVTQPALTDLARKVTGPSTAFKTLRMARSDKKYVGIREERAKAKALEEAEKKK